MPKKYIHSYMSKKKTDLGNWETAVTSFRGKRTQKFISNLRTYINICDSCGVRAMFN